MKFEMSHAINAPKAMTDKINDPVQSPIRLWPSGLPVAPPAAAFLAFVFLLGAFVVATVFVSGGAFVTAASLVAFVSVRLFVTAATAVVSEIVLVTATAFVSVTTFVSTGAAVVAGWGSAAASILALELVSSKSLPKFLKKRRPVIVTAVTSITYRINLIPLFIRAPSD